MYVFNIMLAVSKLNNWLQLEYKLFVRNCTKAALYVHTFAWFEKLSQGNRYGGNLLLQHFKGAYTYVCRYVLYVATL